ncbi:hypothetical protein ACGGZK_07495 [Agromyces sp. MMS24-K17]|uniref:hypothetical protein n=1 Tax=Agromyces sp. MMS24-K17 TaxID=3372850 RepID=UPI00375480BC
MRTRRARVARGAAVAAFAAFTAALAHTVGGGHAPGPLAIVLALAFATPLAMLLAGPVAGRARLVATSASAVATQAALHLLYAVGLGGAAAGTASGGASAVGSGGAGHGSHDASASWSLIADAAPAVDHGHALMPVSHLVAAALTVAALAVADRAFDALARVVRVAVARLVTLRIPLARMPSRVRLRAVRRVRALRAAHDVAAQWYRGPPAAVPAAS